MTGVLRRGATTMNVVEPLLMTSDGWLVLPDLIGRYTHFGATGLLASLRSQKVVNVPAAHEKDFLAGLLEQPGLPRLELPDELALREIAPRPRAELRIEGGARAGGVAEADKLSARLSFEYDGHRLRAGEQRPLVAQVEAGLLIRRDRQAEGDATLRLAALGFRRDVRRLGRAGALDRFEIAPTEAAGGGARADVGGLARRGRGPDVSRRRSSSSSRSRAASTGSISRRRRTSVA